MVAHNGSSTFKYWELVPITLNNGQVIEVSRHMGFLCDGWNNLVWQWMLTSNPNDNRWKDDTTIQAKSVLYFK